MTNTINILTELAPIAAELQSLQDGIAGTRRDDVPAQTHKRILELQTKMRRSLATYQRAVDVIGLQDGHTDGDLDRAATAYETAHGIPLIRPNEESVDEEGVHYPNALFLKRLATFKGKASTVSGDPSTAQRVLRKALAVAAQKGVRNLKDSEKAGIHELQRELGLPPLDFERASRTPEQVHEQAQAAFAKLQTVATFAARCKQVSEMMDAATLRLVMAHDKFEEVRTAARQRLDDLSRDNELTGVLLV